MKRVLVCQKENNLGEDYFVINGELIEDENLQKKAHEFVTAANNWKLLYSDNEVVIKKNNNSIYLESYYNDLDNSGRKLTFVYLVNSNSTENDLIENLIRDSKVIDKRMSSKRLEILEQKLKSIKIQKILKVAIMIILAIGLVGVLYNLFNNEK